jgi:hypothetical protein
MGKKLKIIYVLLDIDFVEAYPGEYIFPVSHDSVIREMKKGTDIIYTHDPYFFCFDILEKGYDAVALRRDNGDLKGVILSGLLNSRHSRYTDKEIRLGNNAHKMLIAGAFEFQPVILKCSRMGNKAPGILKRPVREHDVEQFVLRKGAKNKC